MGHQLYVVVIAKRLGFKPKGDRQDGEEAACPATARSLPTPDFTMYDPCTFTAYFW